MCEIAPTPELGMQKIMYIVYYLLGGSTPAQTPRRTTMSNLTGQTNSISIVGFNDEQFRTIVDLVGHP